MNWLQQIWGRRQRTRNAKKQKQHQQVTRPSFALGRMIAANAPGICLLPNPGTGVVPPGPTPPGYDLPGFFLPGLLIDPGFALPESLISQLERSPAKQPMIAVIDTGVNAQNPYLNYANIKEGYDYVAGDDNSLLASGEGNEHGTFVTGMIQAINPNAELFVSRAIGSGQWIQALREAVNEIRQSGQPNGVVNLSLDLTQKNPDGSISTRYELTPEERSALEYARQQGVLIVAAAGNDSGVMSVLGQASQEFDNLFTVGAADGVNRADYSSYGYGLDLLVPGGTIANPALSTVGEGSGTMTGTSVAASRATGAASLVWAANPGLSYRQVAQILRESATDINTPGWDAETGAGLLDLAKALELAKATQPEVYTPSSFSTPTTWGGEGTVTPEERAVDFKGRVVNTGGLGLRIRQSPSLNSPVVNTLPDGTELTFQSQVYGDSVYGNNEWWKLADGRGYMSAYYLQNLGTVNPPPNLNNTVGYDGTSAHQTYVNTFNRNGGSSVLGLPTNNVHSWGNGYIQDFNGGSDSQGGIMKSNANDNSYWVGGNFWNTFLQFNSVDGLLKYPISDRYSTNGGQRQDFQGGAILKSNSGIFPVYGGIGGHYLSNEGGQSGRLGFPTSGEVGIGNGVVVQNFERGRIVWNNGPTRTEMYVVQQPTSITINGNVISGSFYPVFQQYQGTLGNPVSGVINHASGASYQLFERGSIVSSRHGTFPLYGGIRQTYLNNNGLNGWLGAPTSAETSQGNGFIKQTFENGYIIWNGQKAIAYRNGSGQPGTPPSTGNPINQLPLHSNPTTQNPLRGFQHPLKGAGSITQLPGGSTSHTGRSQYAIDYGISMGTPVYAMRSGKVVRFRDIYPDTGGGQDKKDRFNYMLIEHDNGYRSAYLHLQQGFNNRVRLKVGDTVNAGQLIGYSGNSGWSTGPHLHVEVHKPNVNGTFGQTVPFVISSDLGTPANNPSSGGSNITQVNFSGTVGPKMGVNLRYSPSLANRSLRNEPYNKRLEFDAWTYGETVKDLWTGKPDARWFKVKGTSLWVPSAYIWGNPPNSSSLPDGGNSDTSGGGSSDSGLKPTKPIVNWLTNEDPDPNRNRYWSGRDSDVVFDSWSSLRDIWLQVDYQFPFGIKVIKIKDVAQDVENILRDFFNTLNLPFADRRMEHFLNQGSSPSQLNDIPVDELLRYVPGFQSEYDARINQVASKLLEYSEALRQSGQRIEPGTYWINVESPELYTDNSEHTWIFEKNGKKLSQGIDLFGKLTGEALKLFQNAKQGNFRGLNNSLDPAMKLLDFYNALGRFEYNTSMKVVVNSDSTMDLITEMYVHDHFNFDIKPDEFPNLLSFDSFNLLKNLSKWGLRFGQSAIPEILVNLGMANDYEQSGISSTRKLRI